MKKVMKPNIEVGILGYGAYIPRYRLYAKDISYVWVGAEEADVLQIESKSLPGPDEDTVTMSIEAAQNALARANVNVNDVGSVYVGSESHPYAVKTTGSIVAQVLGVTPDVTTADFEFACKAGTEALQSCFGMVGSGMVRYSLAIGMDTAQGRPGDALEYTAAAGGAAFLVGPAEDAIAVLEASFSYVTDTPDFFRRAYQKYPQHGNRFTGDPGYFFHIQRAVRVLLEEIGAKPEDYSAAVFHQPNAKFPRKVAQLLGFREGQINTGLIAQTIGNTYAGSSLLGFTTVLDEAQPQDRILVASFGSGAGSDVFSFKVTEKIIKAKKRAPSTNCYINRTSRVDYATYLRWRKKIIE